MELLQEGVQVHKMHQHEAIHPFSAKFALMLVKVRSSNTVSTTDLGKADGNTWRVGGTQPSTGLK